MPRRPRCRANPNPRSKCPRSCIRATHGAMPAGTLLNENALASKLSVSRGPIREACRALAELGFVHLIPNRGVFVQSLSKSDAMEVYDLRAGLTGLAGFLLAPIVTEQCI